MILSYHHLTYNSLITVYKAYGCEHSITVHVFISHLSWLAKKILGVRNVPSHAYP